MKFVISLVSAAAVAGAAVLPIPEPSKGLGVRQSGAGFMEALLDIIIGYTQPAWEQALGGVAAPCCDYMGGGCWLNGGVNSGQPYAACYTKGTQVFTQSDADVTKCLINLHYTTSNTCISVKGSSCDNGYLAAGGRIQNVHLSWIGAHNKINSDQSRALQGGAQSMVGTALASSVNSQGLSNTPTMCSLSPVNGITEVCAYIDYIGEQVC